MNQPKSLCPGCKSEVVFQSIGGGLCQCPLCGFRYQVSQPPRLDEAAAPSAGGEILRAVLKVLLIMVGIVVVGLTVLFAGCALVLGGMH